MSANEAEKVGRTAQNSNLLVPPKPTDPIAMNTSPPTAGGREQDPVQITGRGFS